MCVGEDTGQGAGCDFCSEACQITLFYKKQCDRYSVSGVCLPVQLAAAEICSVESDKLLAWCRPQLLQYFSCRSLMFKGHGPFQCCLQQRYSCDLCSLLQVEPLPVSSYDLCTGQSRVSSLSVLK